jgi:hypothetical protein
MTNRIQELESKLLVGQCQQEERKCMILSECHAEMLEKFEYIFEDILYTEN